MNLRMVLKSKGFFILFILFYNKIEFVENRLLNLDANLAFYDSKLANEIMFKKAVSKKRVTKRRNTKPEKFTEENVKIVNSTKSTISIKCGSPLITPLIDLKKSSRIINGNLAISNSWPWLVSIRESIKSKFYHVCAGSIISSEFIITAAHCVVDHFNKTYVAVIGINDLDEKPNFKNIFFIIRVIIHSKFNNSLNDDIALLQLNMRMEFGEKISPICVPSSNDVTILYKKNVAVIGWGSTTGVNSQKTLSNKLLQTVLTIKNFEDGSLCKGYDDKNYCAIDTNNSKQSNICFGDSGGSLMYPIGEKWYLFGISSFIYGDIVTNKCISSIPSFYTIVPNYLKWIESYVEF